MQRKLLSWIFMTLLCFELVSSAMTANSTRKRKRRDKGTCQCGISDAAMSATKQIRDADIEDELVINGFKVEPIYKYPWMVQIFFNNKNLCGGAIIGPNKVLTAAHCLLKPGESPDTEACLKFDDGKKYCRRRLKRMYISHVGKHGLSNNPLSVKAARYSRKFSLYGGMPYDIALLTTKQKFPCTEYTTPICLPPSGKWYKPGMNVTIAGWGKNVENLAEDLAGNQNPLLEAEIYVKGASKDGQSSETCSKQPEIDTQFCAVGDRQYACYGDSGGPIIAMEKGVFYVVGITSHGDAKKCDYHVSQYYTKVFKFRKWIKKNIKSRHSTNYFHPTVPSGC